MAIEVHRDGRTTKGQAICPYCGVGCRLWMESVYGEVIRVKGVADAPANLGGICAKGATLPQVIHTPDRLMQPHMRLARDMELRPVSWEVALERTAERFRAVIDRHGPDAVAFYGSGQLDSEAGYLAVKLFKGSIGTNNTDSNSRLCMAAAVAGYRSSLGADGPPPCYADIDLSDCLVVWGSNMAEAFPVTFDRVKAHLKANPGVELIVVDPRRTNTAEHATLYVPVAPGGDIPLMNAVGRLLIERDALDRAFIAAHTEGFPAYCDFLLEADRSALIAAAGVPEATVCDLADRVAKARAWLTFYCQGLNQSTVGMWKNNSIINLHLLTGQIGKPGAGPFSLTGQPNAMGGREVGLLAQALPGYRFTEDPAHRAEVEAYWGRAPGTISTRPGLTAIEMFRALESGRLKAIWIAATNPAVSLPDLHQVQRALAKAELIVVQDPYAPTETTRFADVLLPTAQWAEKSFTSTNSERLVSFSEQVVDPPGKALPDWQILARFGQALGYPGFAFKDASEVWDELIGLTTGRPCDMAGMTSERLRRERHLRWPCPSVDHPGTERLYLDRKFPTPSGRARFLSRPNQPPRETTDHEFPLVLMTGRLYAHWHTLTRTGKSPKLVQREPSAFVEVHPDDAAEVGLAAGQLAELSSRRGLLRLPVKINPGLTRGVVFVPFHWGDLQGEHLAANYLTIAAIGRIAKQPEYKYCAVRLAPAPDAPEVEPTFARTSRRDRPHKAIVVETSSRPMLDTTSPSK
ncbi:MAG: nitrate reductase [Planctomycetaceae bacterium]|nr:nitrate reductase [Planctomycetaceae bacterium]